MGGPGRGDVRGGPATGGMRELAKDWVIVEKRTPHSIFGAKCLEGPNGGKHDSAMPFARKMLCMYGKAFGGEALLGGADAVRADAVSAIHSLFDGNLWGLREEDVAPCVKQIPAEV